MKKSHHKRSLRKTMIIFYAIFNFLDAVVFSILKKAFGPESPVPRFSKVILVIVLILGVLAIFGGIGGCIIKNREEAAAEKDAENAAQIEKNKGEIEVLGKKEKEIEKEEKKADENSTTIQTNLNRSIIRDSADRNANFSTVKRRYCSEFPNDSKCR